MEYIFHEKQDGALCAQHCLNALLQGPYFTAVDLANIATQLDQQEIAELGQDGAVQITSHNMDESGHFSVQVISQALSIWSLELVPFLRQSPEAEAARQNPANQNAFICHYRDHWFTIRKFGSQWFDLNSVFSAPKLISTTYLSIYLAQLKEEGNAIFIVVGNLPECEADYIISLYPVIENHTDHKSPVTIIRDPNPVFGSTSNIENSAQDNEDDAIKLALKVSQVDEDLENTTLQRVLQSSRTDSNEEDLQRALQLSMDEYCSTSDDQALQQAIQMSLMSASKTPTDRNMESRLNPTTSSNNSPTSQTNTAAEVRKKRQAFLDNLEKKKSDT